MTNTRVPQKAGWQAGLSIALELDHALSIVNGYFHSPGLPPALAGLAQGVPEDWQAESETYLGTYGQQVDLLEFAAGLAGVLLDEEYASATLAIRELALNEVVTRLEAEIGSGMPGADAILVPAERLAQIVGRRTAATFLDLGLDRYAADVLGQRAEQNAARIARLLRGGDLHDRFWHWLDRFYYETYQPWRRERAAQLAQAQQKLAVALGNQKSGPEQPPLDWLPAQSPILRIPGLRSAVETGTVPIFFWIEPFGLSDSWALYRPIGKDKRLLLILSFAQPGELYQHFQAFAADLAGRAAALGDPTRLTILRIIRHFGMTNTDIADFMGLARPTVSIHAKILREAGLIRSQQDGRAVHHEIDAAAVRQLFRDLDQFLDLPEDHEGRR